MDGPDGGGTKMGTVIVDIINNLRLVDPGKLSIRIVQTKTLEVTELSNSLQTQSEKFVGGVTSLEGQITEIRQIFQNVSLTKMLINNSKYFTAR